MISESSKAGKASDWLTPDEVPDPKVLPRVTGWRILVRPVTVAQRTKGGIIVPDTTLDDVHRATAVGRVLTMGSLCYKHPQFQGETWCKVGDLVCYGKFDGVKYLYRGVKMVMIEDKDVRMLIENATDIDPHFALAHY